MVIAYVTRKLSVCVFVPPLQRELHFSSRFDDKLRLWQSCPQFFSTSALISTLRFERLDAGVQIGSGSTASFPVDVIDKPAETGWLAPLEILIFRVANSCPASTNTSDK
jgi:hypothetical protein